MSTAELRAELSAALKVTARQMVYLAAVWTELERRGEDLAGLRSGLMSYLPLIAAGSVLPEVLIQFAGNPTLLRAVSALPPDQQRHLAEGGTVQLVVRQGDSFTHRMLPAHALTASQARQVFGNRCVRTEAEQIAILTAGAAAPPRRGRAPSRSGLRADRAKGVVLHGWKELEPAAMLAALADLGTQTADAPTPTDPSVSTRLKKRAAAGKTTVAALIRNALRATGQI